MGLICKTFTSVLLLCLTLIDAKYEPNWDSLDSRPLPSWYDEAKLGIFIHWGVFAVQSFGSEWAWYNWKHNLSESLNHYIENNYPKGFTYQDFAKDFRAELFNPDEWARIIHSSGAKYVVLTSKHHEGYTLWPSKYSFSWNSMDVGPHKDLIGELKKALQHYKGIKFGLYHSLYEWFNPLYLADKALNFTHLDATNFVDSKVYPQMVELIDKYKPQLLWSDGEWEAPSSYWKTPQFLAWLYNKSPVRDTIVVNDRWGQDTLCKHGGFLTCSDRFNPGVLQDKKWENALSIDKSSWGYRRTASLNDYLTIEQILGNLTSTVSCGGNMLINVGPTKDGIIAPIFEERLHQLGSWMRVNGEAIYKSKPWHVCQNDTETPGIWYTLSKDKSVLYSMFSPWPVDNTITLSCPRLSLHGRIQLIGVLGDLEYLNSDSLIKVKLPDKARVKSQWVWTLKMTGVENTNKHDNKYRDSNFMEGITVTKAQDDF